MSYYLVKIDDKFGIGRGFFGPSSFLSRYESSDFWWKNQYNINEFCKFENEEEAVQRLIKYLKDNGKPVVAVVRKINVKELMND